MFLVLYGTGINESQSEFVSNIGTFRAVYTGETWMTGVQQVVIPVPIAALGNWPAIVSGIVRIGRPGFSFDSQGFDVRR